MVFFSIRVTEDAVNILQAKVDKGNGDNWSVISGNTDEQDGQNEEFHFKPCSQKRYRVKAKRRKKTFRIDN